jgi:hypothetical protein
MQRFRFRLDRVLDWYRKKSQMEESRLAVCLDRVRDAERKIDRLRTEREAIEGELLGRSAIPAADFLNLSCYRLRANQEETSLAEERRERLASTAEQRVRVQRAQQRVKLLEKVRARRLEEHTAAAAYELEKLAADAYLARWSKSHGVN